MKKFRFDYSLKNIPIPPKDAYLRNLIEKAESVTRRMRWKAHFFLNGDKNSAKSNPFGLPSCNTPPTISELKPFEDDLIKLIENVKFRNTSDTFQHSLARDLKAINSSPNIFIFADKTRNMYETSLDTYNKLLHDNITKTYKHGPEGILSDIDNELKFISNKIGIGDRIEQTKKREAFISLKDHKDNFENNPTCRLINPAKSESGKISKIILDKINSDLRQISKANQWRNTQKVIEWFDNISEKHKHTFISFDIVDFYPSISENLLDQALSWARDLTDISNDDISIIKHARKSLLFNNKKSWIKKDNKNLFDVTMGSYDGAEVCELVGLFILKHLGEKFGKENIGLYRDDGLAIVKNKTARLADKIRKELHKIFEQFGLKITAQANLNIVNFLDVTFDLKNGKHKPFRKPNDDPLYINKNSNHPPSILRQLPTSIGKRISLLSCDSKTFHESAPAYQQALKHSGFNQQLKYTQHSTHNSSKHRHRNIIWFNPPFSKNVKTNIGRNFLNLIDKHFPPEHKLHKIFNRNTIKVSYSCMNNLKSAIMRHNSHIIRKSMPQDERTNSCNCRSNSKCPLNGKCMTNNIVYKATVTTHNMNTMHYIGMTANTFKERFRNHTKSFRNKKYANETELSKHIWKLKEKKENFTITWSILKHANSYSGGSKRCNLCLEEKLCIMNAEKQFLLNKRSELVSTCRHKNRFSINNINNENNPKDFMNACIVSTPTRPRFDQKHLSASTTRNFHPSEDRPA